MKAVRHVQIVAVFVALSSVLCACNDDSKSQRQEPFVKDLPIPASAPSPNPPSSSPSSTPVPVVSPLPPIWGPPTPSPTPSSPESSMPAPSTGVVWGLGAEGKTLQAIQVSNGKIAYTKTLLLKASCAVTVPDALWLGGPQGSLSRFDFKTGELTSVRALGGQVGPMTAEAEVASTSAGGPAGSATKTNVIWVGHILEDAPNGAKRPEIVKIDSKSGSVLGSAAFADISDTIGGIVAAGDSVFVLVNNHFGLYRVDARTLKVSQINFSLPAGYGFGTLAKSSRTLWVLNSFSNKLVALDIKTHAVRTVGVVAKGTVPELVVSGGDLFSFSRTLKAVHKLDSKGGVLKTTFLPEGPVAMDLYGTQVWVALPKSVVVLDSLNGAISKSFGGIALETFSSH